MVEDVYLLPSKLFSCEPVDRTDSCNLSLAHHSIINPLKKISNISLHNSKFYSSTPSTVSLNFDYSNKILTFPENSGISHYLSMKVIHSNAGTNLTTIIPMSSPFTTVIYFAPSKWHTHIQSCSTLFFVQYIPDNTISSRWFLVQVLPVTKYFSDDTWINTGMYRISYLVRHPADQFLPDDLTRWWLE